MPARVLYVSTSCKVAGAENSLLELVRALDRQAWEPMAALPCPGPLQERLSALGVPVYHVPAVRLWRRAGPAELSRQAARIFLGAQAIARLARSRSVALIHAQTTVAQMLAGPASRAAGVRCVWHIRDLRPGGLVPRLLARTCDAAVPVSRAVLEASGLTGHEGPIICIIPNGIDADAFASAAKPGAFRRELGLAPEVPFVLMAAQMVPWKGHADFLRTFALVLRRIPTAVAALAGEDLFGEHRAYAEGLRSLARSLQVAHAVTFLGYRQDIATLMADADLVAVPSVAEPFGRVALEAMAVGRAVVGRAFGGLPEVVQDGVTGLLAHSQSVEELAGLMVELLLDERRRLAMGRAGSERVRQAFSATAHAERVCALYRELLGRPAEGFSCQADVGAL